MMQLQINSPQMQEIFEHQFNSNQEKFMEFIVSFIKDNSKIVDNYFHKLLSKEDEPLEYKKLNPMDNFYRLSAGEKDTDMSNPFKGVEDSVSFAKRLRDESYR